MPKTISTTIEDAPKDIYLVGFYTHYDRKDDDGNYVKCCDILRPFKKVNRFDDSGEMTVDYYTKDEWHGTTEVFGDPRIKGHLYVPTKIHHYIFLRYLNFALSVCDIDEIIDSIMSGYELWEYEDLAPRSQELIDYVQKWDPTTPFDFCKDVCQHTYEDEGTTYYCVECFKL